MLCISTVLLLGICCEASFWGPCRVDSQAAAGLGVSLKQGMGLWGINTWKGTFLNVSDLWQKELNSEVS